VAASKDAFFTSSRMWTHSVHLKSKNTLYSFIHLQTLSAVFWPIFIDWDLKEPSKSCSCIYMLQDVGTLRLDHVWPHVAYGLPPLGFRWPPRGFRWSPRGFTLLMGFALPLSIGITCVFPLPHQSNLFHIGTRFTKHGITSWQHLTTSPKFVIQWFKRWRGQFLGSGVCQTLPKKVW
jgi:hypothetical protein